MFVFAYVLRFNNNMLCCLKKNIARKGELTVHELQDAEFLILKYKQQTIIEDSKVTLLRDSLDLFYDEKGLLRLKGRFGNAKLEYLIGPNLVGLKFSRP